MGNEASTPASSSRRSASPETATDRARKAVGDMASTIHKSVKKLDNGVSSSDFIDNLCGPMFEEGKLRGSRSYASEYSQDAYSEDDTQFSDADTMDSSRYGGRRNNKDAYSESESMLESDYDSEKQPKSRSRRKGVSEDTESLESQDSWRRKSGTDDASGVVTETTSDVGPGQLSKPLASSFAKRCYFTKAGIGKTTQHYEGLTLTGNIVLMLASAMKLKGCPTICDEDLRRVEQTYPNQFSRLPDELLLSSGWRRISKYCHFSNKPIPDGIPFFHSRQRIHPSGGYYFLLAAAVGMIRPIDVEPLTRDTLVLLETDYPTQCDAAPQELIQDASQWTLVDKFCFFSGGPINAEEDVYYQADFDGNPIYMLAFLSPSLTPEELYKLNGDDESSEPGLKSVHEVQEVESVYDLTERDFDDLKLYHLGPCRALPQYILQPSAWTKVLPPHFLIAKENAMIRAHDYELAHAPPSADEPMLPPQQPQQPLEQQYPPVHPHQVNTSYEYDPGYPPQQPWGEATPSATSQQQWGERGAATHGMPPPPQQQQQHHFDPNTSFQHSEASFAPPHESAQQFAPVHPPGGFPPYYAEKANSSFAHDSATQDSITHEQNNFQREVEEEGAFLSTHMDAPIDEALATRARLPPTATSTAKGSNVGVSPPGHKTHTEKSPKKSRQAKMDPPEDEPPSLSRGRMDDAPEDEDEEDIAYQESYPSPHAQQSEPEDPRNSYYREEPSYDESGAAPSESQEYEQHNGDGGYYRDSEYYDSPEKAAQNEGGGYYTREEEYYDSPENIPPNGDSGYHAPRDGSYYDVPDKQSPHDTSGYSSRSREGDIYDDGGGGPPPRMDDNGFSKDSEYFNTPETEKKSSEEPEYDVSPSHAVPSYSPQRDYDSPPRESGYSQQQERDQGEYYSSGNSSYDDSPHNTREEEKFLPIQTDDNTSFTDPQKSVASSQASGRTTPSSAMRGAHELLKRNRQKRFESIRNKQAAPEVETATTSRKEYEETVTSPSGWDTGSEMTSVVSGSSVWTDNSNADRSSRRALILQMAKARMKSNKTKTTEPTPAPIAEEEGDATNENPLVDSKAEVNTDISFSTDLD